MRGLHKGIASLALVASAFLSACGDEANLAAPENLAPTITGNPATLVPATTRYLFKPLARDGDDDALTFTISGKPAWADFDAVTGALAGTPAIADIGLYASIVIRVSDGVASSALPAFAITVTAAPNRAPSIMGVPAASARAGSPYQFRPTAADPDGDVLLYSITGKPAWAFFDTATGELTGTPAASDVGAYPNIVITASDGLLASSLPAFTITVTPAANRAPVIGGTPAPAVRALQSYNFTPIASDPDGDVLAFAITGKPGWAAFNAVTGALTGTPGGGDVGVYPNIVISASDGALSTALAAFTLTVTPPANRPPTITGMPATTVQVAANYLFIPTGQDPDGNPLVYAISGKPSWAAFSSISGMLTGTPRTNDIGTYPDIVISVSDGASSAALPPFAIEVTAAPNRAPTITGVPPPTVQATQPYAFMPVGNDADGDLLGWSITGRPQWALFNPQTGALSGTPPASEVGIYPDIVISVSDGALSASLPAFSITVTAPPNRAPVISGAPPASVPATTSYSFVPTASDADGDALAFAISGRPAWAAFNTSTGALTGTPAEPDIGVYPDIRISVTDGSQIASLAAFTVTVTAPPNRAPQISGAPATVVPATIHYAFVPVASDADGDALTFAISGKPAWATFNTYNGALTGTPAVSDIGTYADILISTGDGALSATLPAFSITVVPPPNHGPAIAGIPPTTVQATTNYSFLPAASDPDGDALTFAISGKPSWAVFDTATGALTGTPTEADIGSYPDIVISSSDGALSAWLAAFSITVTAAPNRAPVIAGTPPASVQATTHYSFIPSASDPDGDRLTFGIAARPSWATFDADTGMLAGTPAATDVGIDANIVISVSDGSLSAALAAFAITVTAPPNRAPVISGTAPALVQATTNYSFLPAASDADGDALTFSISGKPSWAVFSTTTGALTGSPAEADLGTCADIVISVSDGSLSAALAAFSITVTAPPNRAPVLSGTPPASVQDSSSYSFVPVASDPDGDALTFSIAGKPSWAVFNAATGALTGTPATADIGAYPSIVISVSDGLLSTSLAAFSIMVTAAPNHTPSITGNPAGTVQAGTPYSFVPGASDPDGDTLTFSISGKPSWATFSPTTGALSGTPAEADIGIYPDIVISVSDGSFSDSLAAFTISVTAAPNRAPIITGTPSASVQATTNYSFLPAASDPDGDVLTFTISGKPSWAVFSTTTGALAGTPAEADIGAYPDIVISVSDGSLSAALAAFAITVTAPPNRAPLISGTPPALVQATTNYSFLPAASDPDGDALTFSIAGKPSWALFDTTTGALTGTPAEADIGTCPDIVISVSDGSSSASLGAFTISVTAAPNRAPVIAGTPPASVQATTHYSFIPSASDPDGDALTFAISGKPSWAVFDTSTGALSGMPTEADVGAYPDIVISVSDGSLSAALAAFSVTVTASPNRAPVILGTAPALVQATTNYSFLPTASDLDGDALTFAISGKPSWALFDTSTGALTGSPAEAEIGTYADIVISVSDGTLSAALAAFSITVTAPPNRAPVLSGTPPVSVQATTHYSFLPTASDPDGDALTFSISGKPSWALFDTSTGALTGSPAEADLGTYADIVISVSDGTLSAALAAFSITVTAPPNRAPVISGTPPTSVQDSSSYSFVPVASDPDGDALTFSIAGKPSWAVFNAATGALTGTPATADVGAYPNIIISVSDGALSAALAAFSIMVTAAPNHAPVISGTPATVVAPGSPYSFTPDASDADGDVLGFSVANKPSWAAFSIATGALTGTPAEADTGLYPNIVISVSDGMASAELPAFVVRVMITGPADSAVISWEPPTQNEDGSELTNLAGFVIRHGPSPDNLVEYVDVPDPDATSHTFTGLASGVHYFAVVAYNDEEAASGKSGVVSKTVP